MNARKALCTIACDIVLGLNAYFAFEGNSLNGAVAVVLFLSLLRDRR